MDPSPGNIAPSWPVAIAHGIRNTTNPMIHHPNAAGPADWITAAFVMNKTIATKIATMSNVVSTLGRMPPATRSEIREPEPVSEVIARASLALVPLRSHARRSTHSGYPGHARRGGVTAGNWHSGPGAETARRPRMVIGLGAVVAVVIVVVIVLARRRD